MKKITILLLCICFLLSACALDGKGPEVTLTQEESIILEAGNEFYADDYYTIEDNFSEREEISIENTLDSSLLGVQSFTFTAIDKNGNKTTTEVEAEIIDTTAPQLTLNGDSTFPLNFSSPYEEQGVTVIDNQDANCTIEIAGDVDSTTLGEYTISYTVTDVSNNQSSIERIVKVCDLEAPVFEAEDVIQISLGQLLPEIYATDNLDGDVLVSATGEVNYCKTGEYSLELAAEDMAGNKSTKTVTLEIIPLISESTTGMTAEFVEFSTDVADYNWMENAVLVIYFNMYNTSDQVLETAPLFYWINDSYSNHGYFNSLTCFAFERKEVEPNTSFSDSYVVAFSREADEFFACTKMYYDPISYTMDEDLSFEYEICFQDLFAASTIE